MERINDLLAKLDNKVSPSLVKKLNGLKSLKTRLGVAKKEYEADPTEENKESLEQIEDYIEDIEEDIADDLQDLLDDRNAAKQAVADETKPLEASVIKKDEEEGSFGILGALGVVAAIGVGVFTLGKLNLFDKK
jgi:translation elongation factor EF-1beta